MHNNTTQQEDQLFALDADLIAMVREGMTVQDINGQELGTVERVKLGDSEATTTRGSTDQRDNPIEDILYEFAMSLVHLLHPQNTGRPLRFARSSQHRRRAGRLSTPAAPLHQRIAAKRVGL